MKKTDLIDAIAEALDVTKAAAEKALNVVTESVVKTLQAGDDVTIAGFGKFHATKREARDGRNPATGETIRIAAAVVPKFKAAKALKEALN